MFWIDYSIEQGLNRWRVSGDYPGEVMGFERDGTPKDHYLYKPGEVYIVDEDGWLRKTDEVNVLLNKYEQDKKDQC